MIFTAAYQIISAIQMLALIRVLHLQVLRSLYTAIGRHIRAYNIRTKGYQVIMLGIIYVDIATSQETQASHGQFNKKFIKHSRKESSGIPDLLLLVDSGQRLTPHSRTLEVRPGRINKKLELHYDYDVKGMILNYYSVSQMYDLVLLGDRLDSVIGYNSVILPPDR